MKRLIISFLLLSLFNPIPLFAEPGVLMLAGGGPEGDIGVKSDWSYQLYKQLIENGDVTGDKKIKVVVVSLAKPDTNFMVDYLKSFGADSSENLVVASRKDANNPKLMATLKNADVVFFRGGNQGKAYQEWKGTLLHKEIQALSDRSGAIGGTSSGSMALAEFSITGGKDFDSVEIMTNPTGDLLNDEKDPKSSGIHNDFLNLAKNMVIDTHCGERGRLGRVLGVHAKAVQDYGRKNLTTLCLEEKTGVVISKGKAKVYGTGLAHFITETNDTEVVRSPGKNLTYLNVRNDALTDGWTFDLKNRLPDTISLPSSAQKLNINFGCGTIAKNQKYAGKKTKSLTLESPLFSTHLAILPDAFSIERLLNGDSKRGVAQTIAFHEMGKDSNRSIVLLDGSTDLVAVEQNLIGVTSKDKKSKMPMIVLDCKNCEYVSTSPFVSTQDDGSKKLYSNGFVNMRIHVVGSDGLFDLQRREGKLKQDKMNLVSPKCDPALFRELNQFLDANQSILKDLNCQN